MLGGVPPASPRGRGKQHHRPQAEDDLHLADEVENLRHERRLPWPSGGIGVAIGAVLDVVREREEPRREEGVQDGEREDARRHEVERVLGDAIGQRLQQACWRRRRIVGQRRREMRGTGGTGHLPNISEPGARDKA